MSAPGAAEQAAPGVVEAFVGHLKERTKEWSARHGNHVLNNALMNEMNREVSAMSYKLPDPGYYRTGPLNQPITINTVSQAPPAPAPAPAVPAEPAKKAGSLLKTVAMTALMATGGGGLVAAGGFGAYSLLKEQLNKPVQIDPANFKARISFDPDKGIEAGPLEPAK